MKADNYSRRKFIKAATMATAGAGIFSLASPGVLEYSFGKKKEPIIDIHQHTDYHGRSHAQLVAHQRAMGVVTTILLPAGRPVNSASTHGGVSNGLQAQVTGNEVCVALARQYPKELYFGANEVPDVEDATVEIEKYLRLGAKVIGESKFGVECDSPEMQKIYQLAEKYDVPVLMHWQFQMYNYGLERFHKMLEKYPKVNFIGHAQTWWANIDKNHVDQSVLYPKTKVIPGGITDRLLSDYPNMFGDLSAGSGLNSLQRDEDHAREFLKRHADKLLYGSDCADAVGRGVQCDGASIIAAVRKLSPDKNVERKILFKNARRLFRL